MNFYIITASYNSEKTILNCFNSLNNQKYFKQKLHWHVIDGDSKDDTVSIVNNINTEIKKEIISESDEGLYFAYNKGINFAKDNKNTIINFLDSDNEYYSDNVFNEVSEIFEKNNVDVVFTDLVYVNKNDKAVRFWNSKLYRNLTKKKDGIFFYDNLNLFDHFFGWSIPLPTIFVKSDFLNKNGQFNTNYSICADYDWSLRMTTNQHFKAAYIPKVFIKMKLGGVSNKFSNLIKIKQQDLKIIFNFYKSKNIFLAIFCSIFTLIFKNIRKLPQFFVKH